MKRKTKAFDKRWLPTHASVTPTLVTNEFGQSQGLKNTVKRKIKQRQFLANERKKTCKGI